MKQARLDQLADGIFAIVMTILVFDIRIPEFSGVVDDQMLVNALIDLAPTFLSYILSFSLLFTYWRSHHFIESVLAKNIDLRFSNLNAIFFFFVALVPFSAHFLGNYSYSQSAIISFAVNIILIGLSLYSMRQYVLNSANIQNATITITENEHANMRILFPVGAAVCAIVVSLYNTDFAIALFTLAILFNLLKNSTRHTFIFIDLFRNKKVI